MSKSPVASVYRNARIVLLTAEGLPAASIAHALGVSVSSVRNTIRLFRKSSLDGLTGGGAAGRPSELTDEQRRSVVDLLSKRPSEFGIDKPAWTASDLALVAEREGIVGTTSPATVKRIVSQAGYDWHEAKRLCANSPIPDAADTDQEETNDAGAEEGMSMLGLWSLTVAKTKADQERLVSIYGSLVRRYGSGSGDNHLQLELLATHLLGALKDQESGNREGVNGALVIVRSHLEELETEALRKTRRGPAPGSTPAEVASELLRRWREAQDEDERGDMSG